MLKPGSLALRRPLPLDSMPEEAARLRGVGEGTVCVDLAGESLIQRRHFHHFSKKTNNLARLCSRSIHATKSPSQRRSVSNGWGDPIRRCSSSGERTGKAVFGIHITYFQAQRCCSDAVSTLSQLDAGLTQRQPSGGSAEAGCSSHDPDSKDGRRQHQRCPVSLFASLVAEKKVTADQRAGTKRCSPHEWAQSANSCGGHGPSLADYISEVCAGNLSWLCKMERAQVSLLVYLCLHLSVCRSRAENKSAPMWRQTQEKLTDVAHFQGDKE